MKLILPTILVPLFAAFITLACGSKDKKTTPSSPTAGNKPPPLSVEVLVTGKQEVSNTVEVPGTLLPFESTAIQPEVAGRLVKLNINEGAYVGQGTILAQLYDGDQQARITSLNRQIKKLEVQLKIAQQTEDRSAKLLKIQGISQQDYDLTLLQVNNIMADMEIVKAQIAEVRAGMTKLRITAPFAGKLGLKKVSPGAYVSTATILTTISQVNQLKLAFSIPEKYSAMVKSGGEIVFSVDGSTQTFRATVMATEGVIDEATRALTVRAIVQSKDKTLIPGAFANVKMTLGNGQTALLIPNNALVPQGRKKIVYLFQNNKAITREVTTGARDSVNIQILSGLQPGDSVITTGLLFLKPEASVKIQKVITH
jgi:membrane fusion protein (multidrug efflux system)